MRLGRSSDADGHILELPDLWQKNFEAKFKERALGIARDKNGVDMDGIVESSEDK